MTRRDALALLAGGFLNGRTACAQDPGLPAELNPVNVHAVVRTTAGRIVRNLEMTDFVIDESGRRQVIRFFAPDADVPLTLGLLIDTSSSQRRLVERECSASFNFLRRVLRTAVAERQDRAFVIQFDSRLDLLQALTSSPGSLESVLAPAGGRKPARDVPETRLYDAVVLACERYMKWEPGRKACVVLTDGLDYGSESTLAEAIESAQRADTLIYSILFVDWLGHDRVHRLPGHTANYSDGVMVLERMARETGGAFFEVSRTRDRRNLWPDRRRTPIRIQPGIHPGARCLRLPDHPRGSQG